MCTVRVDIYELDADIERLIGVLAGRLSDGKTKYYLPNVLRRIRFETAMRLMKRTGDNLRAAARLAGVAPPTFHFYLMRGSFGKWARRDGK